jgi:hypothetical protein
MGFDHCNSFWRSRSPPPTPNMGVQLGSVNVHSHTLPHSWVSLSSPVLLQTLPSVVSPRLGLRQFMWQNMENAPHFVELAIGGEWSHFGQLDCRNWAKPFKIWRIE